MLNHLIATGNFNKTWLPLNLCKLSKLLWHGLYLERYMSLGKKLDSIHHNQFKNRIIVKHCKRWISSDTYSEHCCEWKMVCQVRLFDFRRVLLLLQVNQVLFSPVVKRNRCRWLVLLSWWWMEGCVISETNVMSFHFFSQWYEEVNCFEFGLVDEDTFVIIACWSGT